ncbi:MAG: hypothetical protein OXG15_00885 [Gammaproteobacteria bacterium]|nr:hypothetical protein [Gammaproteobacteria bacterium]
MNLRRAESGLASKLDNFQLAFQKKLTNVRGDGYLAIETGSRPACMVWHESDTDLNDVDTTTDPSASAQTLQPMPFPATTKTKRRGIQEYESRLAYLRDEAEDDDCVINPHSETDFRHFIESRPRLRKGDLVLMDNGNLRAIWESYDGAQLGLQFLGGGSVQFVVFTQRPSGNQISRVTGRDSMTGLEQLIRALDVQSLLFE